MEANRCGSFGGGYDRNFVLNRNPGSTPSLAARVEASTSGRVMEGLDDGAGSSFLSPTVIFSMDPIKGKGGKVLRAPFRAHLETQQFS